MKSFQIVNIVLTTFIYYQVIILTSTHFNYLICKNLLEVYLILI